MTKTVYLCQHGSEVRVELDPESYEELIDSRKATIVDQHANGPVVAFS
jgi:hypothetical protein